MNNNICIVFVCNKQYINNFINSYFDLINNGKYKGDICLIIGNDLKDEIIIKHIEANGVIVKYFEEIIFSENFYKINNSIKGHPDNRHISKKFQWHKLHVFDIFFKKWDYIFYIDSGMIILNDIENIINEKEQDKIIAHSDAFDKYEILLNCQFDETNELFNLLNNKYNLNIDYFQTGMMLIDTNIISNNTKKNLIELAEEFPISKTNEQGIIALYYTNIENKYKPIRISNDKYNLYDYCRRNKTAEYIMFKYNF